MTDILIPAGDLRAYAASVVRAGGSVDGEAEKVANQLIEANLRSHDSHGISLLPDYVKHLRAGNLKPNQSATVVRETDTLAVIDGHHGYGQVIGEQAMAVGIAKAKKSGVAMVAVRRSHHLGRIGHWAEQCCAAGLASMHFVSVASHAAVAPWGGADGRLGTNPVCDGGPGVHGGGPGVLRRRRGDDARGQGVAAVGRRSGDGAGRSRAALARQAARRGDPDRCRHVARRRRGGGAGRGEAAVAVLKWSGLRRSGRLRRAGEPDALAVLPHELDARLLQPGRDIAASPALERRPAGL